MKCPKCSYEPTMTQMQQSPDCCPSCGVYYAKLASRETPAPALAPPAAKITLSDWVRANPSVRWVAALLLGLTVGYFAGREHVKYEIKSAMQESLAGIGAIFGGGSKTGAPAAVAPAPKAASKPAPITVVLQRKGFHDGKYEDQISLDFLFTNATDEDVRAFEGVVVFRDLLANDIMRVNLAINEPVAKRQTLQWSGGVDYNQFMDSHQRLNSESQENLMVNFEVKKVLYADGKLEQF